MGVSFKISKAGRRFIPKPIVSSSNTTLEADNNNNNNKNESSNLESTPKPSPQVNVTSTDVEEDEVSFALILFPDGYSIGRPSENCPSYQAMLQDPPKFLHPYDRSSEALFSAIESGRLPGDILDDIPCKYVNGTLVCEVRDYRNCSAEAGFSASPVNGSPVINKVRLRMSLENVVKDIPLISDSTWTYGDLMEVESRILRTLQPQLCLNPIPKLDRLCENPVQHKLNLDVRSLRMKRRREMADVIVTSSNKIHGKKVCIYKVPENAQDMGSNNAMVSRTTPDASLSSKCQMGLSASTMMRGGGTNSNASGTSLSVQDMIMSSTDSMNRGVSSIHARRDNQSDALSPESSLSKRARLTSLGPDSNQQQQLMGATMDSLHGSDLHWKNTLLHQQQFGRGFQYTNNGLQKFPQQTFEGGLDQEARSTTQFNAVAQQGIRFPKEEPVETDKSELNLNRNDFRMVEADRNLIQQRLPSQHAYARSNFPQPPWNNFGQPLENNSRKEEQFQKKKSVQSPRVSGGGLPHSPLSSKSGEFSSGSVGPQLGPATISTVGSSRKDKSAVTSVPAIGGATSLTSSANDNSMQRQQQVQIGAKRRTNSLPKTSTMSGVGSPASVSNMSVPLNASSPADEMLAQVDSKMLLRFSKVEAVANRHQINCGKNKKDEKPFEKSSIYSSEAVMLRLSEESSGENFSDESENKELAKSLVGGSVNACKIRVLTFVQNERIMQGNGFALVPKSHIRMILSANPSDGTIAMHYGDMLESESLIAEENLPTLPNAHFADLLAAQLSSLMTREGYEFEDKILPKPIRVNHAQQNTSGMPQPNAGMEIQQYSDAGSGQQQYNEVAKPTNSGNQPLTPNQNVNSPRMLPPQNPHALQISQGFLPGGSGPARPQQNEPHSSLQQQPSQLQRSPVMLPPNQLPQVSAIGQNSNALLGSNQMLYKPSHLQYQLMHQQQQQPPRKMMMGMGGNIANNGTGLGGLSNVIGMGGPRGIGGPTISGPMGPISGMGQNPMNLSATSNISNAISQQIRSGHLTPQHLMAARIRLNKGMLGGGAQSSLGGIAGARQMHPGSSGLPMLGHSLNRDINSMQRSGMGTMAPPKLIPGMNFYMNPQLQQQQQQQQQQHQQQQQQQQMQLQSQHIQQHQQFQQQQLHQQQDAASPLQTVVSPPQQLSQQSQQQQQASPQQMSQRNQMSPQQMSQRTPMSPQLSSGAVHSLNMGNADGCPASPQLSSQTLGSVSSIANSPMKQLQVANKNSSVGNA